MKIVPGEKLRRLLTSQIEYAQKEPAAYLAGVEKKLVKMADGDQKEKLLELLAVAKERLESGANVSMTMGCAPLVFQQW